MVGAINHVGGVDSGGARHTDWVAKPDALALLSKSLCTLQALVSNMEESGEGVEHVAREIIVHNHQMVGALEDYSEAARILVSDDPGDAGEAFAVREVAKVAITAVLGTFDLEALKTLVGEIDDVLGGTE